MARDGAIGGTRRRLAGPLLALLTVLTWSTYSLASAAGAAQGLRPWDMTLLRFGGGALLALPLLARRGGLRDLGGLGWRRGVGLALAGGPLFGLVVYSAFALAPLAHATVFPPACVMVTGMVLSALLLDERPGRSQLAGCALLALGLLALAYDGLAAGGRLTWLGDLLFSLAGCSWGVFTFLLRRWRVAPLRAVAAVTVPSALAIVPAWFLITGGVPPPVPAGTILAQWFFQGAMGGVLGVAAFGGAVRALGVAKASALPSFTPAVTTLLGIPALGRVPTRLELLGMGLATLGLLLAILGPGPGPRRAGSRAEGADRRGRADGVPRLIENERRSTVPRGGRAYLGMSGGQGSGPEMKGIVLRSPGGLDRLELVDMPDPGIPGPGEIRVRLHASSLNYHDYGVVSGRMRTADGRIPMSDGAGVVEAVGEGVTEFTVGDHVVSCFFPEWQDGPPVVGDFSTVPGDGVDGYAREAVVRPATWFTPAPSGFSHAEAATLTTAGLTAWRALVVDGGLKAGEVVLVLGTGGVSIFALQLAKAMGALVIATSSSDEKLERARAMGADHTINYRRHEDWGSRAFDWTGGRGVDQVIEVGGPGTLAQSIAAVRIGGHVSLIGVLTGLAGEVPTAVLMRKQARLQGLIVGSRRHQMELVRAIGATGLRPMVDRSFALAEIASAFRYEEAGAHFGKICLEF